MNQRAPTHETGDNVGFNPSVRLTPEILENDWEKADAIEVILQEVRDELVERGLDLSRLGFSGFSLNRPKAVEGLSRPQDDEFEDRVYFCNNRALDLDLSDPENPLFHAIEYAWENDAPALAVYRLDNPQMDGINDIPVAEAEARRVMVVNL